MLQPIRDRLARWVVRVHCLPRPVKLVILTVLALLAAAITAFAIQQLTKGEVDPLACPPLDACRPWARPT